MYKNILNTVSCTRGKRQRSFPGPAGKVGFIPRLLLSLLLIYTGSVLAGDKQYQLGRGLTVSDALVVGGYFSTEYINTNNQESFSLDDLALLAYGSLTGKFSYLAELEWADIYKVDFKADTDESNLRPIVERFYGDYKQSDNFSLRFGKQITPIGYWNLQPINVLRETTSNPILSRTMFPQFLTGLDVYGYTPFDEQTTYHIYLQATGDLDNKHINIDVDSHFGVSLEKFISDRWQLGGSAGRFTEVDGSETYYIQMNSRLDTHRYSLIAEAIADFKQLYRGGTEKSQAFYLQGEYRINASHALIGRIEYFHDGRLRARERIGILGYSYRPVYPVSFKIEYQWHADTDDNGVLSSFSVLF